MDLSCFGDEAEFTSFAADVVSNASRTKQFVSHITKLPQTKRGEFWRTLFHAVKAVLNRDEDELCRYSSANAIFPLALLAITTWMDLFPQENGGDVVAPPQSLLDLLGELHDSLFELHEEPDLQEEIAQVCERWYLEARPMRENFLPQLIPTLVIFSFETNANRVFALRETLRLFDLTSEEAGDEDSLKHLLLKCFVSPVYLKSSKGRRVLTFIMSLSKDMLQACHAEMQTLCQMSSAMMEPFAQVYYETWLHLIKQYEDASKQVAEGTDDEENRDMVRELVDLFETGLVQNEFVHGAIYHRDVGKRKHCLKMLDLTLHENKKERRVDALLCRIYAPLVFSSLHATNAEVRRNAASLLFNAFPLHDPYSGVQEIASLLDKQFVAMEELLLDANPDCRACAADGVCKLLALFWETIPKSRCSKFLQILVNDLAFDKSSPLVRQAVLGGLAYMLDFPLCHAVLKTSIKYLKSHFHDRALQVRVEYCKLLGKLDATQGFAFTEIVSIEDVLHRLVLDESRRPVKLLLCKLLVPLFFPKEVDNVEQLKRARMLAESNLPAAKLFFANLKHVTKEWNRIVKLTLLFGSFVNARRKEMEQGKEEEEGEEDNDDEDVANAIACICALWGPIAEEVAVSTQHQASQEKLREMFDAERFLLPLWNLRKFHLLDLCKLIGPGNAVLEKKILKRLYLGTSSTAEDNVDLEVDLICSWNGECLERVVDDCIRVLTAHLEGASYHGKKLPPLDECRAVRILARIATNQCSTAERLMDSETGLSEFWYLFTLAKRLCQSAPGNRVANALVLLDIKLGMQREDDLPMRDMLALIAKSGNGALSHQLIKGALMLGADCSAMGFFLLESARDLLEALPKVLQSDVGFHALALDAFLYQLLAANRESEELVLLVCGIVKQLQAENEGDCRNTANFLLQWFHANPKQVFRSLVFQGYLENQQEHGEEQQRALRVLQRAKCGQIFALALDELERDPSNQTMLAFVRDFACSNSSSNGETEAEAAVDKRRQNLVQQLLKFSSKIGGVLGDQIHNLSSELQQSPHPTSHLLL